MWQSLRSSTSSATSGGRSGGSACSDTVRETDKQVRAAYSAIVPDSLHSLGPFVTDHMRRANNRTCADSLLHITNSDDFSDYPPIPTPASDGAPRWRTLATEIIQVVASVSGGAMREQIASSAGSVAVDDVLASLPESLRRRLPNLHGEDLAVVLSICVRTLTLLCVAAGAFSHFGPLPADDHATTTTTTTTTTADHAATAQAPPPSAKPGQGKKRRVAASRLWFEMVGNRSKRKLKHVAQVQLLVHISRMIENPTAERDADFPFCPDAATDLLHALSQSAARQQLCRSALRATATLEEMFLPGPAAALQRRRSRSPDRTAAGSRSSCSSEYTDNCGIAWTPKLRRGCALLGGVTHQVRGAQLQLEFEIARANDEFDLPPVPMFAAPPPSGWISRFAPLADVFCHDGDGDPVLWLTMSKELKRVGVRERMIQRQPARVSAVELGAPPPPRPVLDVNDAAGGDAGQQLQQQQQPDARVVGVSTPVASEHKGGDNAASAAAADARSNASGDRETDNNDGGAANMNDKAKRRMGKDPFRHADGDGRERFAVLGGSAQQPVLLPTAFSRVVADRAAARSAVHDSFQRIQQLTAELREEVARYSACAEAATVLEEVAPRMAERAARDLAAVRRVSEFLVAACAVATAAPRLVVDMPAAQFEQCVSRYLGLSG